MKRIRPGAWLASALSALHLVRLARRSASGAPGANGPARGRGPVKMLVTLVVILALGGYVLCLMFSGPRMRIEPKILPYQALMPALPAGMVPVAWRQTPNLESVRNPVADTQATRRIGQAYYRDYCAFCHGAAGHGDGPVGRSYVPTPADLTAPAVRDLSDGALARGMLTGIGHAPVLGHVVEPNAPWYIIHHVRTLGE